MQAYPVVAERARVRRRSHKLLWQPERPSDDWVPVGGTGQNARPMTQKARRGSAQHPTRPIMMPRIYPLLFFLLTGNRGLRPEENYECSAGIKNVLVTKVQAMDVPVQLHEFGRLSSPESVNVQPQVNGRIMEVHFVEGKEVKKGDLLFVIDPRPFQADLEQAQGQLKSDQAQLDFSSKRSSTRRTNRTATLRLGAANRQRPCAS